MSVLGTLARAEAVAGGRAVAAATVRHRHVADRPLVFVPLTTAGEAGAPLGAMIGTDRDAPELLVVPQPLDRELRFAFFAGLAEVLLPLLDAYGDDVETEPATRNREEAEVCADALQIVVPNGAAVEFVRLVGRSTRFLRTVEDPEAPHPVPVPVPLFGRWLSHYAERARTPGSGLLVAMTDLLARHWASGQSAMEDRHLGALLGWIAPPPGLGGLAAATRAQTGRGSDGLLVSPPAGPATDPVFDNRVLAPAMSRYDEARTAGDGPAVARAAASVERLVASQLRPTWDDVWRGIDLLRELPEGAHVAERWKRDRWSFTGHRDRVRAGEPPQPRRDDAITAAQKLAGRETAQARLFAQEALDDPLVMADRRLAGEAFSGEVAAVEMTYSEGRRPMPRPLVTVATGDVPQAEPGAKAYRAVPGGKAAQSAELVAVEEVGRDRYVTVRLTGGMGSGRTPKEGSVPEAGDRVCFTFFEHEPRSGPALPAPEATPWTHGGPPGATPPPAAPAGGGPAPVSGPAAGAPAPPPTAAGSRVPAGGRALPVPGETPDPVTAEDYL
ncbi:hypothetical protein [Actinacidiphila sp. ITFR-21]|uniref:hypothetical protein n=1 Tax=Actinacidiphila sp. ITFR-21 TaxID=3075199 RepID=UPI00288BEB9C|nr:hypothetical protein [Streptomyces sp. ITFR-21]WNI15662.1 hypothetical protein RLT57_09040 [Streptomyces sp. ITFR-21]